MVKMEQTKRLRYCSVCKGGIGAGEFVLVYSISSTGKDRKNICDLCARNLSNEVNLKNQKIRQGMCPKIMIPYSDKAQLD